MRSDFVFKPTDGRILPCRPGEQRSEYNETASGLRLRVTAAGARSWLVSYWSPTAKTQRRLKLGNAANMPLSRAHAAAREALALVDLGRDPFAEKLARRERERESRRQRAEERRVTRSARRAPTVSAVCADYVKYRRTVPSGRFGRIARPQTLALWAGLLRRHVEPAPFAKLPIDRVTPEDILEALEAAVRRAGPTMGPSLKNFLSAVWRWAEKRPKTLGGAVAPIAFAAIEKVGHVQMERERVLSPAEVWSFWRATDAEGLVGEALRFTLLTATRVKEALLVTWDELDTTRGAWNLPAERSKNGKPRTISLSRQALDLLKRVEARNGSGGVFGERGITRIEPAVIGRIRASMGGEHWEPRDLRRTAATLCARLGADPFTVALVLGHSRADERMPSVTRTYLRWNYADKVREALDKLGAWIEETARAAEAPGTVVEFRR